MFTTSGAEAVEAAIKLVRSRSGRPLILSAQGSFHGKTLGALAVTGQPQYADGFGPLPSGVEHIPFGDAEVLALRLEQDGQHIAAVFLEPIQGERGVYFPPPGYLAQVRELCTHYEVALVLDEIQTGLGRTGKLFAYEHSGITPDVLLVAKALGGGLFPLGACLSTAAWWDERFALRHSSTFANNNVASRVGLAILEKVATGPLCREVARKGDRLLSRLVHLAARYPRVIAAVRGQGLLCALELRPPGNTHGAFLSFIEHHGLYAYAVAATIAENTSVLVLPTLGETSVLRIAPPLVISNAELAYALDGLETVCAQLDHDATGTIVRALGALDACMPTSETQVPVVSAPVALPPRRSQITGINYAFLVHYTSLDDVLATDPALQQFDLTQVRRFCAYTANFPPGVILRAPTIHSHTGAVAEGVIIALPLLPEDMARYGRRHVSNAIRQAVDLAASLGATIVGLGGYTTPYSQRGLSVIGHGPAITTGNALTAGMAFAATQRLAAQYALSLDDTQVAVVGARGSVGTLLTRLLARERPWRMVLVANPTTGSTHLHRLREELAWGPGTIEVTTNLKRLTNCDIVISASGSLHPILDDAPITPGTIICDVARPYDTSPRLRARTDIAVIDGGLVALPDPHCRFGVGNLQGLPDGVQLACLSETILLALERDTRNHSIGNDVSLSEVDYLMALAERHGFSLAPLSITRNPVLHQSEEVQLYSEIL